MPVTAPGANEDGASFMGLSQPFVEGDNAEPIKTELGRPTLPKGTKLITFPIGHSAQSTASDVTSHTEGQSAVGTAAG